MLLQSTKIFIILWTPFPHINRPPKKRLEIYLKTIFFYRSYNYIMVSECDLSVSLIQLVLHFKLIVIMKINNIKILRGGEREVITSHNLWSLSKLCHKWGSPFYNYNIFYIPIYFIFLIPFDLNPSAVTPQQEYASHFLCTPYV